jgi:membrane-associated protein
MNQGMKILLLFLFTGFIFSAGLNAQTKKIKLINQYEANVKTFTISSNGTTIAYRSGSDTAVEINTGIHADSSIIKAEDYKDLSINLATVKDGDTITMHKIFSWKDLLNPMFYIFFGGLWLLLFIIFAETGLLVGFFLPGDSLLFIAGIYSKNLAHEFLKIFGLGGINNSWIELLTLIALVSVAGIFGNLLGYTFGKKIGPTMFQWRDRFLFRKKYLYQAQEFYDKNGGGAIIVARFLPIIRTFAPIVAGIVRMSRAKFGFFNVIGCIAWVSSMILAGHFLQQWILQQFKFNLKDHLEVIVIGIVLVTTAPVIIKLFFGKKKNNTASN